jgi:hypothetical protein
MDWWLANVFEGEYPVLEFKVATWGERFKGFVKHVLRVFKAGDQSPAVDIIKFLGKVPFIFCVINFEIAVWWDTVLLISEVFKGLVRGELLKWLNWTEICPDDLSRWE